MNDLVIQKKLAKQITEQSGDYVFNLKGNQSTLYGDAKLFMANYVDKKDLKNIGLVEDKQIDKMIREIKKERRCFMTSLKADAKAFAKAV